MQNVSGKTGLFVVGVVAGVVGALAYLRVRGKDAAVSAERLTDSVDSKLRELESRIDSNVHLDLVQRTA
ncbi:MAG: hypothetical protein U0S12_07405 [Fimbriimonadales bacterium]